MKMSDYYQRHLQPVQVVKSVKRLPFHRTFYWFGVISTIVFATGVYVYSPMVSSVGATKQYRDEDFQTTRQLAIRELRRRGDRQSQDRIVFYEAQLGAQNNAKFDNETYNAMLMRTGKWRDADTFAKALGRRRENAWDDSVVPADQEVITQDSEHIGKS